MNWRAKEHFVIVEAVVRLALYAVLLANCAALFETLRVWRGDVFAGALAFGIEATILVCAHIITERATWNATKPKSAPAKAWRLVLAPMLFFCILSSVGNVYHLLTSGAGEVASALFGASAPLAASFLALLSGDEAAIARRQADYEAALEQARLERQRNREEKKRLEAERQAREEQARLLAEQRTMVAEQAQAPITLDCDWPECGYRATETVGEGGRAVAQARAEHRLRGHINKKHGSRRAVPSANGKEIAEVVNERL